MTSSLPDFLPLERPLVVGLSGGPTGAMLWDRPGGLQHLAPSKEGFSVYAVGLSPHGQWVAAGTKAPGGGQRGNVEVWGRASSAGERAKAGAYSLRFPVYAVDWVANDVLAVGTLAAGTNGIQGVCQFFRVGPTLQLQPLAPVQPEAFCHAAPVVVVKALGEEHVLTVCYSGVARIWNLSSGDLEFEATLPQGLPPLEYFMPSALILPDGESVIVQVPSGILFLIQRGATWTVKQMPGLDGPCGGFACLGESLIVNDWGSPTARRFRLGTWESLGEVNFRTPFQTLLALSPTVVAVRDRKAGVTIWEVEPTPRCLDTLHGITVHALGGGPSPQQLAQTVGEERDRSSQARLAALQASIADARDLHDIRRRMDEILESGHGFAGLVLLADWCREQVKPLAEVKVRAELCRDLPEVPESALHLRIFGELLAALGEPELAVGALRQAQKCDPSLTDLSEVIERLSALATGATEGPGVLHVIVMDQGAVSRRCERAKQGGLRDGAVGREAPRSYAVELKSGIELGRSAAKELDLEALVAELSGRVAGALALVERTLIPVDGVGEPGSTRLLSFKPRSQRGEGFEAGVLLGEFCLSGGMLEYSLLVGIDSAGLDCGEAHLDTWLARWTHVAAGLESEQSAFAKRREAFEEEITRLAPRLLGARGSNSTLQPPPDSSHPGSAEEDDEFL